MALPDKYNTRHCQRNTAILGTAREIQQYLELPEKYSNTATRATVQQIDGQVLVDQDTLHTIHSALHTIHSALHTIHSALHTLHSALHTIHSALHTIHSALHTIHSPLHTIHSALRTIYSALYTIHSALLSVLHTIHSTLHTIHSTSRGGGSVCVLSSLQPGHATLPLGAEAAAAGAGGLASSWARLAELEGDVVFIRHSQK